MSDQMKLSAPSVGLAEAEAVARVIHSGWLTNGPKVEEFEKAYADFSGWKYAVATNSATMASAVLFNALNLGPDDEIAVPDLTFCSPAIQALKRGVRIRVVDVDWTSWCMPRRLDLPEKVYRMPTDYAGFPSASSGPNVLTDSACFHGERPIRHPRAAFTSFYANKALTTGEGGMLLTDDEAIAEKARMIRLHGISLDAHGRERRGDTNLDYDVMMLGEKANMTDIAAAIGLAQLVRYPWMRQRREIIAARYRDSLGGKVLLQEYDSSHTNTMMPVVFRDRGQRDLVQQELKRAGIPTTKHYPLLSSLTALRNHPLVTFEPTPVAKKLGLAMLSLPIHPALSTEEVNRVCDVVLKALR